MVISEPAEKTSHHTLQRITLIFIKKKKINKDHISFKDLALNKLNYSCIELYSIRTPVFNHA